MFFKSEIMNELFYVTVLYIKIQVILLAFRLKKLVWKYPVVFKQYQFKPGSAPGANNSKLLIKKRLRNAKLTFLNDR